MLLERRPQLGHVLTSNGLGQKDRRAAIELGETDDRAHLVEHRFRTGVIHLVDCDHIGNLHDPSLERLHGVAGARHEYQQHGVGYPCDLDLALTRTYRLHEDDVLARCIEQEHRLERRLREASEVPACPHRADVHTRIEEVIGETDAVAE